MPDLLCVDGAAGMSASERVEETMRKLADVSLQLKDREAIAAAAELLKERFPVQSVTLSGSQVTGRDNAKSDSISWY